MPVPTAIGDLSQTAGSNSPAGTESPITADNYFRAHAAFIAQLQAEKAPIATPTFTGLVTTAGQVKFPATQSASSDANTLDDYEEGSWTPAFSSSSSTFSYDKQIGRYTKVGNKVTVWGAIKLNTTGNTLSGNALTITGLPFAARTADAAFQVDFSIDWVALDTAVMGMSGAILPTATFAYVNYWIVAMTTKLSCTASILSASAGSYLSFTATYETD